MNKKGKTNLNLPIKKKQDLLLNILFSHTKSNNNMINFKIDMNNEQGSSNKDLFNANGFLSSRQNNRFFSTKKNNIEINKDKDSIIKDKETKDTKKDVFFNLKKIYNPNFVDNEDYMKYRIPSQNDYLKFIERNQKLKLKELTYSVKDIKTLSTKLYYCKMPSIVKNIDHSFCIENTETISKNNIKSNRDNIKDLNRKYNYASILNNRFDHYDKDYSKTTTKISLSQRKGSKSKILIKSTDEDPFIDINIDEQDEDEINHSSIKKLIKNIHSNNQFFDYHDNKKLSNYATLKYLTSKPYLNSYFMKIKKGMKNSYDKENNVQDSYIKSKQNTSNKKTLQIFSSEIHTIDSNNTPKDNLKAINIITNKTGSTSYRSFK